MDNALMHAMTDVAMYGMCVFLPGFNAGYLPCFSPINTGQFQWVFS